MTALSAAWADLPEAQRRIRVRSGHGFDPERDIAIDEHGSLRWSSDKPALHRAVREYFEGRREAGRG